jgi:pilus assembly protein CpaE
MKPRTHVLIAGRSQAATEQICARLANCGQYEVSTRLLVNGDRDALQGLKSLPQVLVLHLSDSFEAELEAIEKRGLQDACALIVVGNVADPAVMRLAMRAGSKDFLTDPVSTEDLFDALSRIELSSSTSNGAGAETVAFVNSKGGCGATFLATNMAHILTEVANLRTVLVDLDLQFATLPQYLDLSPKLGLLEALGAAYELDELALDAYYAKHDSGLRVIAGVHDATSPQVSDVGSRLEALIALLTVKHQRIVLDVPRHLDALGATALQRSDQIVLVTQQNLPAIRDAVRFMEVVQSDLGIDRDRVIVAINRYRRDSTIELSDIKRTLKIERVLHIPNHYKSVSESIDAGVPLLTYAKSSPVTKALVDAAQDFGGTPVHAPSFLSRKLAGLLRT